VNKVVEMPSGKGRDGENFPVGSWLIPARLRGHVHAFYDFARMADDVADSPHLPPEEKLRRLDRMAEALETGGSDAPAAAAMGESLRQTGITPRHCLELLDAFRQDAVKQRYVGWDDLMAYCRLSAAPVGRYLLDLHEESRDTWPDSDALCAALQVINHLQDCGDDYRQIDRVYLPQDWLVEEGIGSEVLARGRCCPELRRVLDRAVEETIPLVRLARFLSPAVRHPGLRAESAVITALAEHLLVRLARQDPLAIRVKLGPLATAGAVARGLVRSLRGPR
jgi:farnesyl-diphosphate farnesyltransferase